VLDSQTCDFGANRLRVHPEGNCPRALNVTRGNPRPFLGGGWALRMRIGPLVTFSAAFADLALKAGLRGASGVHHATAFAFP